jgi:hypothetical protein
MKAVSMYVITAPTCLSGITSCSVVRPQVFNKIIITKITKTCMYSKNSFSERFLLPKSMGSVGIIDMHNLHNS